MVHMNILLEKKVSVLTNDGRILIGKLVACDGSMNLVLQDTVERVIRPGGEESSEVPIGVYIVRGDTVCVVGRVDEELDAQIDWTKVHGDAIGGTYHT
ncbi:Sm-like ribonucleoprotein [Lindgomyces ingoldianus]|uniref:Sm-like ribonucleoprotein n=1 Tax=Lindgomyces ingoldianus TaxID=673940 RepID=A0ACB6R2Y3_9PLEO|nr:Sm-like ribonucleoprotein [Lindgomyces ingoldianus]KAF2473609.1 Sm-like ribonucleoprotein [Lindgomyces ingoldianus]